MDKPFLVHVQYGAHPQGVIRFTDFHLFLCTVLFLYSATGHPALGRDVAIGLADDLGVDFGDTMRNMEKP